MSNEQLASPAHLLRGGVGAVGSIEIRLPPRRRLVVRATAEPPVRRGHLVGWTAHDHHLIVQPLELIVRQFFELAAVEARKPLDALALEIRDELQAGGVEADVSDRQKKILRLEPAAA